MDSNKRLKPNHEDRDFISKLPDFIIGVILSLLPTKEAIRTCVLSKRWIYLWTFINVLEIEDREPYCHKKIRKTPFYDIMDKILLHLKSSRLQSFSLSLSRSYKHIRVDKWMYDISNLRVNELFIKSNQKLNISLHSLLKSPSLEVLALSMKWYPISIPTFLCLSFLTVLKFSKITFRCDTIELGILSLNFPVLREYDTKDCIWSNVKSVTLEVPLLEVLRIRYSSMIIGIESNTIIKFCAPHVAKFSYHGCMTPDTNLFDLSEAHIASAYIDIHPFLTAETEEEMSLLACQLLMKFNNSVECLTFQSPVEIISPAEGNIPVFRMLSNLKLANLSAKVLLHFLQNTPFLKTLILKDIDPYDEDLDKELSNPDNVPSCFKSNLQRVSFGGLHGEEHELRVVKFVFENAKVLEIVNFSVSRNLCMSEREMVKEKMVSFAKSGSDVPIEFLPPSSLPEHYF